MYWLKSASAKFLVALFLLFTGLNASSQTNTPRTVSVNSNCGGYMEYLPADYNTATTKKYPTLIYIHGGASFGNGSAASLAIIGSVEGVPYYIAKGVFPRSIVTPYGDTASYIVISPQFIRNPTTPSDMKAVIDYVLAHYRVDVNRLYLTGYSLGGNAVWQTPANATAANRIAAMVPNSGYNYPYYDTTAKFIAGANMAIWTIHSNADQQAPVGIATSMINKINSYNPPTKAIITLLNSYPHDSMATIPYNPTFRPNGKNIYEWLLQFAKNYPPIANAGSDASIVLPTNTVTLNGSASSDRQSQPLTYSWTRISGPSQYSISSAAVVNPVISNLIPGNYIFKLTVTNTAGLTAAATVKLYVISPNGAVPPIAKAGQDQTLSFPQNSATLNGSSSTAPNGAIESYTWAQLTGPTQATIGTPSAATTSVSNLRPGIYNFTLTITDNLDSVGKDTVQIKVVNLARNIAPVAKAGADQTIGLPASSVTLSGSASSDTDGIIASYRWRQVNGPSQSAIGTPNAVSTSVSNLATGIYQFELTVRDDSSAIGKDTVQVSVNPLPKLIQVNVYGGTNPATSDWNNWNATSNLTATALKYTDGTTSAIKSVLSASTGIADNGTNYPTTMCPVTVGRYSSYYYTPRTLVLSGLDNNSQYNIEIYATRLNASAPNTFSVGSTSVNVTVNNNYATKVNFNSLTPSSGAITINMSGSYNYLNGFTITENGKAANSNKPPVANAGADQTINLPTRQVTVNGSASGDPDGTIASYSWTQLSGPTTAAIAAPGAVSTTISGLDSGAYIFQLTVTDNKGAVATAIVNVAVGTAGYNNTPPVANAGPDVTINIPLDSVLLDGTASRDPDGSIAKYSWTKISGPAQYSISDPASSTPMIRGLYPGTYQFQLTVTDNFGVTSKDTVAVIVTYTIPLPPTANAGADIALQIPIDSIVLNGSGSSDKYSSSLTYSWNKVAGPDQYSFNDSTLVSPKLSHLTGGTYIFELTVTNDRGVSAKDSVTVTVKPNLPPTAFAGYDTSIILPVSSVQLSAAGSNDPDGTIASYRWKKIAGPAGFSISDSTASNPAISQLTAGTYTIALKVTDNLGATGADTVVITVYPAPNTPPIANAGPDQTIILPASTAVLNGSASKDNDGPITSYHWTQLSGPVAGALDNPDSAITNIAGLVQGSYSFELAVTDDSLAIGKDTITINVKVNLSPIAAAGNDITLVLPTNSVRLDGSSSNDPDGTIASYRWKKIDGPAGFTINDSTITKPLVSSLTTGVYTIVLTVTDNQGAIGTDTLIITVYPVPNKPPVANAGPDQTIVLPASSVTLNGSASKDNDGVITTYHWRQLSGPSSGTLTPPDNVSTTANGLVAGSYSFELAVTDDSLAVGKDTVVINVSTATRLVKVNVYGGSTPAGAGWNNWNVSSSLTSAAFNYSDGTASTINAVLSGSTAVADNGANYPTTMCPTEVGRTTSYSWDPRTLTISGLDNSKKYNFELYCSRTSGNQNTFTINGVNVYISPSNNYATKAAWTNITPTSGKIVVSIFGNYNYLNGFTLTENAATGASSSTSIMAASPSAFSLSQDSTTDLTAWPNPFRSDIQVQLNNSNAGQVWITIVDQSGRALRAYSFNKGPGIMTKPIPAQDLPNGTYFIQAQMAGWRKTILIVKQHH